MLLIVRTKLNTFGRSENPSLLLDMLPVAIEKPTLLLFRMALARPVHEHVPEQVIILTHGCG